MGNGLDAGLTARSDTDGSFNRNVPMRRSSLSALAVLVLMAACTTDDESPIPTDPNPEVSASVIGKAPRPLTNVTVGGKTHRIWAFVSADLDTPDDPVNLIFAGAADPIEIRSALLRLDGNRGGFGFPSGAPFDCVWSDAIGGVQGAYAAFPVGWVGSAIQLQCGGFGPIRFHLRLFKTGAITLGGAHFEVQIPGTTDHQVLSWELAEQLVTADLMRSGLLGGSPQATPTISPTPSHRGIPPIIYNGLPNGLKLLAGGPLGSVGTPVPIATDGRATVLSLARRAPAFGDADQTFTVQFDQVIPRPFCATSPDEYLYVTGPVHFTKTVRHPGKGELSTRYQARAELTVVPVDPTTGQPTGTPYRANVADEQVTATGKLTSLVSALLVQTELPALTGRGRLREQFHVGPVLARFDRDIACSP